MAKILSNAVTWIVVLLLAIIALLLGVVFEWWGGGKASPSPTPTSSASPSPPASSVAPPAFVERPVTVGPYVPDAEELTAVILASAGSGWVVAIDDTTQIDTAVEPHPITPDQKILYLISPVGVRYELANLDGIGLTEPNLVAWDSTRGFLLLVEDRHELNVFDMATGAVASSWTPCVGEGGVLYGEARGGNWLVRGTCEGDGFDGLYTDTGTLVPSGIVGAGPYLTVKDVGDVQVQYEFEGLVDEKFIAFYLNGTSAPLPWSTAGDCYPLGKGRGETLAMYCYSNTGHLSVWELPVNGTPPVEVVTSDQLEEFAANKGGFGPYDFWVSGYRSDSALQIVQFGLGDQIRLGVLYGGTVEGVSADPSYPFRRCHAVSGTSALVSGGGGLWWVNLDVGGSVTMIPPMGSGSSIQTVGTDGYMIGIDGYTAL
ncbi:MAG: hypothetical protein MUP36_03445, partial [Demequinaceae bacterium]|nr:hypothetical protein [Demequinaceae bacterium]